MNTVIELQVVLDNMFWNDKFAGMKLNLKKNIVFLDIEATGLHIIRDRIVQIALIKCKPGNEQAVEKSMLINPGIPISEEAYGVHGIGPEQLANKPTFKQVAQELFDFIGDADLAGYNSDRYDIPMLMEEFHRAGLDFSLENRLTIDVQKIFYKMEPRILVAAYRFYCNEELEGAHDALADVKATRSVLEGQLARYEGKKAPDSDEESPIISSDVDTLAAFTRNPKMLDVTQRLKYNESGQIVFNFGKYIGQPVIEVLEKDPQYRHWILDKEFSVQVKSMIRKLTDKGDKRI